MNYEKNAFIIILEYLVPLAEIDNARPEHLKFLDIYYKNGTFLFSGRQNPINGGVIVAIGSTKEGISSIMSLDPFIRDGLAKYTLYEFVPTKSIDELKSIFGI